MLVVSAMAAVDLPVATQGTEQWAGVVAKAMTVNGRSQEESLQALQSFKDSVAGKMSKTVRGAYIVSSSRWTAALPRPEYSVVSGVTYALSVAEGCCL